MRFPIAFDSLYRALSSALLLPPSASYVEIVGESVHVRMGWAFRCVFPRSAVASTTALDTRPLSRGVHGFGGRWLVNGSGRGLVALELKPTQRGYVLGFPVRLRQLQLSMEDPLGLARALSGARID